MWYEIVPCLAIMGGLLSAPFVANRVLCYMIEGKPYGRQMRTAEDRKYTMRDERLSGNKARCIGLDAIPDKA